VELANPVDAVSSQSLEESRAVEEQTLPSPTVRSMTMKWLESEVMEAEERDGGSPSGLQDMMYV